MTPSTVDGLAAVLWDMDGTLIDSEKLWDIPLYELGERLGGTDASLRLIRPCNC